MGITQETIVLNSFGFEERKRTTSSGTKSRFTVTIKADAIPHVFDSKTLGRGPAEAIAHAIQDGIRGIRDLATTSTILARKAAAKAYAAGATWATARYSGGRTPGIAPGSTAPASGRPGEAGDRLFNDSGRLANGVYVGAAQGDVWTVNVTANRFDPSTFNGGVAALTAMVTRLQSLVPALRSGAELAKDPRVREAINDSIYDIIYKVTGRNDKLRRALNAQTWSLVRQMAQGLDLL